MWLIVILKQARIIDNFNLKKCIPKRLGTLFNYTNKR